MGSSPKKCRHRAFPLCSALLVSSLLLPLLLYPLLTPAVSEEDDIWFAIVPPDLQYSSLNLPKSGNNAQITVYRDGSARAEYSEEESGRSYRYVVEGEYSAGELRATMEITEKVTVNGELYRSKGFSGTCTCDIDPDGFVNSHQGVTLSISGERTEWDSSSGETRVSRETEELYADALYAGPPEVEGPPESEDSGVRFSALKGTVEITPEIDKSGWRPAGKDTAIPVNTLVRTSANSSCTLTCPDGSTFIIAPSTIVLIGKAKDNGYGLEKGKMKLDIKKVLEDPSWEIDMDMTVSVIRGTTLVLEQDEGTSTVKVVEGEVEVTAKADGETQTLEGGEMVSATEDGLGKVGEFDVDAELAAWKSIEAGEEESGGFPAWLLVLIIGVVAALLLAAAAILAAKRGKQAAACAQLSPAPVRPPAPAGQPVQTMAARTTQSACTSCGNPLGEGLAFCNKCGKPVQGSKPRKAFCTACGASVPEGHALCGTCGRRQ